MSDQAEPAKDYWSFEVLNNSFNLLQHKILELGRNEFYAKDD